MITRDGNALATVTAEAGQTDYTYTDTTVPAAGTYTYAIYAVNADGIGETATADVYVGRDALTAPTGLVATDNFDGSVTLTWDAPSTTGANGGYVDMDQIINTVTLPDGTVKDSLTGTTVIVPIATTGTQELVSYQLAVRYADEAASKAVKATSNSLIAGAPYVAPFSESFAGAAAQTAVWNKEIIAGKSTNASISARSDADYNADGGGLDFVSYAADIVVRYTSPLLDLSATESPVVSMMVKMPSAKANFALQAQQKYGEWETIATLDATEEWTEVRADLANYRSNYVRLGLCVTSLSSFNYVYVDDIRMASSSATAIDAVVAGSTSDACAIYTIQGVRVADMTVPGIYIVRTATGTRKVLVR